MQQVIRKFIDQLIEKYPLDKMDFTTNCDELNTDGMVNFVAQMVSEFSRSGVRNYCNISPDIKQKLDKLFIIYEILDEAGYQEASRAEDNNHIESCKREAMIQLRMLFLRALNEIIYLLDGGYASASFGRSRVIYEIGVFLDIITENSEDISKAFLDHSNYSRYQYAKELNDSAYEDKIKQSLLSINPDNRFWKSYKWAAPLINSKQVSFKDLAQLTDFKEHYHLYIASCQSVHATIIDSRKGIGLSKEEQGQSIWITEPSENGIDFVMKVLLMFSEKIIRGHFTLNPYQIIIINILILGVIKNDKELIDILN